MSKQKKEWSYNYNHMTIKTDHGIEIVFKMDMDFKTADYIYIDECIEIESCSSTCDGMFFVINQKLMSLTDIKHECENRYEMFSQEAKQEERDAENMARELSSPYLTGRL